MALSSEASGVLCLALAALLSLLSVSLYFMIPSLRLQNYGKTHINGYFRSLLLANALQAFGTVLDFKWAVEGTVTPGHFCNAQGGIKQAGNITTALWTFLLAVHLFTLLVVRRPSTNVGFWCTIVGGWAIVVIVVLIGPTLLETPAKGPYFGPSGAWCWIAPNYIWEQIFLEYLLEYVSAGCCIVLYTFIVLRMRGNLVCEDGKWMLRFLPRAESWKLAIHQDIIDSAMLRAVKKMVWYPIAYTWLILPITIVRILEFTGTPAPFGVIVVSDVIFNLTGFVNVILLVATRRLFPDAQELPQFSTVRPVVRTSVFKAGGIAPFTIKRSDTAEQFEALRLARAESAPSFVSSEPVQQSTTWF
ncbi:hypothetical protein FB451DRAFT_1231959 [Mycena latifolia]|nr:hypothetical protein FB451DRAFT_1231959 [Mycena latifolia]